MAIDKFDYDEPVCVCRKNMYSDGPVSEPIPIVRIIAKLDDCYERNDLQGAERLLNYWIEEAAALHDTRGEFSVKNELLGVYRKSGKQDKALALAEEVLALCDKLGNSDSPDGATAYVNIGTVLKAFGRSEDALPIFNKARAVYEKYLGRNDDRLAGLYNNMALAETDLGNFREAEKLFLMALDILSAVPGSGPEQAVTYLNIASCEEAEKGFEAAGGTIAQCIDKAWKLLDDPYLVRDGNYAFVCDKCASGFEYFGYPFYAGELRMRSEAIYARS